MKSVLLLFIFLLSFSTYSQEQLSPEQWRADLEFLQKTIHNEYDFLFKKTSAEEFDNAVANLHDSIPLMQDHEIVVGLSKVIALFKYGHTDISFSHPPFEFRHLPFNLYQFREEIYIQGTHKNHQEALGAKVLAIGGVPIDKALKAVYPVVNAENEQYFKAYGINYLRLPAVLHSVNISPEFSDKITLTLEKEGQSFTHEFTALPKGEYMPIHYSLVRQEGEWLDAREQSETPYYLRNLDKHYYYEILPDGKTMYVRQSSVFHDPSEDIPSFYKRVFKTIEDNDLERMVLDLRL